MIFWDNLPRPFLALAPMDDATDVVFRRVVLRAGEIAAREKNSAPSRSRAENRENFASGTANFATFRPDVFFTEFTNAASFCSEKGKLSTRGRLTFTPDEQPIVAQIWGTNPDNFREMTTQLFAQGFAGVDINMGCPDKTVVKNGAGSGLIDNPDLAVKLIRAAKAGAADFANCQNSEKLSKICSKKIAKNDENNRGTRKFNFPISVKTRLGARDATEFREWLPQILCENVANLTIHLRTRKEMSKVPAHFELIPEILKLRDGIAPATKITINGDILSRAHAAEIREKYFYKNELTGEISRVDGFMIGRGVFANPFCFTNLENPSRENLLELLNYHLDQFDKFREILPIKSPQDDCETASNKTEIAKTSAKIAPNLQRKFDPLKHFFKIYVRDFDGAKELREQMMAAKTTAEIREILRQN